MSPATTKRRQLLTKTRQRAAYGPRSTQRLRPGGSSGGDSLPWLKPQSRSSPRGRCQASKSGDGRWSRPWSIVHTRSWLLRSRRAPPREHRFRWPPASRGRRPVRPFRSTREGRSVNARKTPTTRGDRAGSIRPDLGAQHGRVLAALWRRLVAAWGKKKRASGGLHTGSYSRVGLTPSGTFPRRGGTIELVNSGAPATSLKEWCRDAWAPFLVLLLAEYARATMLAGSNEPIARSLRVSTGGRIRYVRLLNDLN